MIPPGFYKPFMPLPAMVCADLDQLQTYLHRQAPEMHEKTNGQRLYLFVCGLMLLVHPTGRVFFQGPGAAGLRAQEVARQIEEINTLVG